MSTSSWSVKSPLSTHLLLKLYLMMCPIASHVPILTRPALFVREIGGLPPWTVQFRQHHSVLLRYKIQIQLANAKNYFPDLNIDSPCFLDTQTFNDIRCHPLKYPIVPAVSVQPHAYTVSRNFISFVKDSADLRVKRA